MIKVSETAKKKVIELMADDGFNAAIDYVRVGVKSGGCSGLSYDLNFDKEQQEGDKVFEDNDIKIIVDKKSFLYLIGTTLEYSGGLNGTGFVFNNPTLTVLVVVANHFHYKNKKAICRNIPRMIYAKN